jgi:alkylhydroperoxidase family enzyme
MEVRTTAVRGDVAPKEEAIRQHEPQPGAALNEREALALQLAERMALDPHTVDDAFFTRLKAHFSDEEIVELVFACAIFNWGNKFNITLHMDTEETSAYRKGMAYRQEALS